MEKLPDSINPYNQVFWEVLIKKVKYIYIVGNSFLDIMEIPLIKYGSSLKGRRYRG